MASVSDLGHLSVKTAASTAMLSHDLTHRWSLNDGHAPPGARSIFRGEAKGGHQVYSVAPTSNGADSHAYVALSPAGKIGGRNAMIVTGMFVGKEHRGKGLGKTLWQHLSEVHPDVVFVAKPDPSKDKSLDVKQLGKVYESYGFKKVNPLSNVYVKNMTKTAGDASDLGFHAGMVKAAARARALDGVRDQILGDLRTATGDQSVTGAAVLDDLVPKGKALEALVLGWEHAFRVELADDVLARLFAGGTADDAARAFSVQVKTAEAPATPQQRQAAHARYMARRPMILAAGKSWRMAHMSQIRRKAKAYRRKVKRGVHRPKKRVGTAGSGYSFIPR